MDFMIEEKDKKLEEARSTKDEEKEDKKEEKIEEKKINKEQEYLEGWKRERAAFLNYKKEEVERMKKLMKFANEELILRVLDILDNIDIAEKELPKELENNQWVRGVLRIKNQILDFLKKQGVEEIKSLGEKFNPCFHEAKDFIEDPIEKTEIIIEEIKKGYLLHGKVIRPAKVKITK